MAGKAKAPRWVVSVGRLRPRLPSTVVSLALVGVSVAACIFARHVVNDQEHNLLSERAGEVSAILETSIVGIDSALRVLGPVGASSGEGRAALFADSAGRMVEGSTVSVGVAEATERGFVVVAAAGDGPVVGETLEGVRSDLASRAFPNEEPSIVADLIVNGGETRLVLARRVKDYAAVSFVDVIVSGEQPVMSTAESPFRGLVVALYASTEQNVDRLVLTTDSDLDGLARTERLPFQAGADQWLLVVGARDPLLGTFAGFVPWLILAGGVGGSVLIAMLIEVLVRRREYAMGLVRTRTDDLEAAVRELGETRSFLERLLTAGPTLVVRLAVPGRHVTYVSPNAASLFEFDRDAATSRDFFRDLVADDDQPGVGAALLRLEEGMSEHEVAELRFTRGGEVEQWVSAVFVPQVDEDGQVVAILGYIVDIDDRRRAERAQREAQHAAESANRAKSEFLSRMSHELRTPLNAVLGFGQLLEIDDLSVEQRDAVDHILKAGRHLLGLINEVLDISRIEAGELQLSPEPVLAGDVVRESIDLIRPLADQRGIQVTLDRFGACDCFVYADRQRVKQILLNLLSNAVKYNRPRGAVAVTCEQPGDIATVFITVTDTGVGIPSERLDLLFTPFERLGAEHTAEEGTGIGLALSLKLAEAMGGTLRADSQLGRGTTLTLELPRVEGPVERYERLTGGVSPIESPRRTERFVVLQIEDNLSNVTLVERVLAQRPGVEVVAAMQGRLGLELAREHDPGLILLDLHLPDMGGEQVLQRLRDDPATASIPVVIVSADATEGQIRRLLTAGATAYLTKPIDVQELLGFVDEARSTA